MIFIAINQQQTLNELSNNQSSNSSGIGTTNGSVEEHQGPAATRSTSQITNGGTITTTITNATASATGNKKPKNNAPLEVVIVNTAKVQDLIGLICWQYTNEGREPKLNHDINRYCLRIAEDNGEVDPDFTSLNPKELLRKFDFPSLAITEKTEEPTRTFTEHPCPNGSPYNHRPPQVTSLSKIANASSRFAALTRILFRDAKLDVNQ
jgi:hypothetical protein